MEQKKKRRPEDVKILELFMYVDGGNIKYRLEEHTGNYRGVIGISKTGSVKIIRNSRRDKYLVEKKVNTYELQKYLKEFIMVFDW